LARIIQFDSLRKKSGSAGVEKKFACDHKYVVASTVYRTVRCSICGVELDPFDVLVDMLKAYVPPEDPDREKKRLLREVARRSGKGR